MSKMNYASTGLTRQINAFAADADYIDHSRAPGLMPYVAKRPTSSAYYCDYKSVGTRVLSNACSGNVSAEGQGAPPVPAKSAGLRKHLHNIKAISMIVAFVIFVMSTGGYLLHSEVSGYQEPDYTTVVVKSGDTLWSISQKYVPDNMDIRDYINSVSKINGVEAGELRSGMALRVPVYI